MLCFSRRIGIIFGLLTSSNPEASIIGSTKCLNWNEDTDIMREEHGDSGYVDYIFNCQKVAMSPAHQSLFFFFPLVLNLLRTCSPECFSAKVLNLQ